MVATDDVSLDDVTNYESFKKIIILSKIDVFWCIISDKVGRKVPLGFPTLIKIMSSTENNNFILLGYLITH